MDAAPRELVFAPADLRAFARASGDLNPLHLDADFARRTPFGACIVHGSLLTLAMLGSLADDELRGLHGLRCVFAGAVFPGDRVRVGVRPGGGGGFDLTLSGRGKTLARVKALRDAQPPTAAPPPASGTPASMTTAPRTRDGDELGRGWTHLGAYAPQELEGVADRWGAGALPTRLTEGLAWASYVVGMELPGLHGLFSSLSLAARDGAVGQTGRYVLRLEDVDPRSGRLELLGELTTSAGQSVVAAIEAFRRDRVRLEEPLEPAGRHAAPSAVAVVGASRGLGAALSLALLRRGHSVHALYARSVEAAAELAAAAGNDGVRLALHEIDARDAHAVDALASSLASGPAPLEGLVLAAAPSLVPAGLTADSSEALGAYVDESVRLAATPLGALLPELRRNGGWIAVCSSPAVDEPPRDWPHYVAAKSAVEGLARWVAQTAPEIAVCIVRPPRMLTDMTNTPSGTIGAMSPAVVAAWIADRVGEGMPRGLSLLDWRAAVPEQVA